MAQQIIAPVIPNFGPQADAMAGAQSVTFTATDRQIIKERAGEIDKTKSFKELFAKRDITHKVENEQSTINPEQDLKSLESRRKDHRSMLKHSPMTAPQEHVAISDGTAQEVILPPAVVIKPAPAPASPEKTEIPKGVKMRKETASLIKELNLNPAELYDKFALEQEELHTLVYRIKELHLKRLLSTSADEFKELSGEIMKATLAAARPEAREWLEGQLNNLTRAALEYKAKLAKSLKTLHLVDLRYNAN